MQPGRRTARSGIRKRWALTVALVPVALVAGAVVVPRVWPRAPRRDAARLGLLHAAWSEFNAQRYDRASAILDRRAAEVAPTSLDWMLRARIAESQGRLAEALGHLEHIPETDSIGARARLKAG